MEAFYRQIDESRFESTPATAGVWTPDDQHAGPPAALLARQIELHEPREGTRLADVRSDILGPVPIAPLEVEVRTLRTGRSMELLEASANAGGRTCMVVRAWRIRRAPEDFPLLRGRRPVEVPTVPEAAAGPADTAPSAGTTGADPKLIPASHESGYGRSVEWRFLEGGPGVGGPALVWGRQLNELVEGEVPSPWQRVLVLADSGGGVSLSVDPRRHRYINCDLHVALDRDLAGEWMRMSAQSLASPGHGGVVHDVLADVHGEIGHGLQTMVAQNLG